MSSYSYYDLDNSLYDSMAGRHPLKDAPSNRGKSHFTNASRSRIASMTSSNQDAIMRAAAGAIATAPSSSCLSPPPPDFIRLQSGQVPGSIASTAQLATTIAAELKDKVVDVGSTFIDRLFPENSAPFPIGSALFSCLHKEGIFNRAQNCFIPPHDFQEATVCQWFNDIGRAMESASGMQTQRRWWFGTGSLPPSGSDYGFKPDLVLLDQSYYNTLSQGTRISWFFVRAFAEVTAEKTPPARMRQTINTKSYVMSACQLDRRFTLALSLSGSCTFTFTLTDHEGQVRFSGTALSGGDKDNATIFLRILSHLMFGQLSAIGLDTNFTRDPDTGRLTGVSVGDRSFRLEKRIYTADGMLGRNTKVWTVSSKGREFIMKDSWVRVAQGQSEATYLETMLGHDDIQGFVPTIECGGDVVIDGQTDWTTAYRGDAVGPPHGRRVHRRIVTTPIGKPITRFKSKKELISVLMDIIRSALPERRVW